MLKKCSCLAATLCVAKFFTTICIKFVVHTLLQYLSLTQMLKKCSCLTETLVVTKFCTTICLKFVHTLLQYLSLTQMLNKSSCLAAALGAMINCYNWLTFSCGTYVRPRCSPNLPHPHCFVKVLPTHGAGTLNLP